MDRNIWLLFITLSCCLLVGASIKEDQHGSLAIQRLLESKEFQDVLLEVMQSTSYLRTKLNNNYSTSCINDTVRLLNNTGVLIRYVDSIGKPASSILLGNVAWLGSFDTCQDLNDAHYCLSSINFYIRQPSNITLPVRLGGCFPKTCGPDDFKEIFPTILELVNKRVYKYLYISYYGNTVCPVKPEYTTGAILTLLFCGLLLLLCLLGTAIDLMIGFTDGETAPKHYSSPSITNNSVPTPGTTTNIQDDAESSEPSFSYMRFSSHETNCTVSLKEKIYASKCLKGLTDFLLCFSILRNTTKIFDTHVPSVAITSVNGIRVISMFWVIFGHTLLFIFFSGIMENPLTLMSDMRHFSMMVISSGYFSVDSFFFLSGLLVAYTGFRKLEKSDNKFLWIIIFYVHRYFRLTPSIMFVILFYSKLTPYLAYTPTWYQYSDKLCGKYWWTNLLYINNFYPTNFSDECVGWSWYLANDMQFFIITPLFLLMTYRYGSRGLFASAGSVLAICSLIIAILYGVYDIDPMALGKIVQYSSSESGAKAMKDFQNIIYDKPYTRIQPYLVGFFLGYFMHCSYSGTRKPGWALAGLCWLVAIATGLSLVYAPYNTVKVDGRIWSSAEKVIYGTTERFLWGVVLAWVIYACHNKYGGLVQRFLSARFWIPLSRLTYSAYLVHPIVLTFMFSASKSTHFYSSTVISYYFIAAVVLAYAVGYILAVVIEFPCDNLENLVLKKITKRG